MGNNETGMRLIVLLICLSFSLLYQGGLKGQVVSDLPDSLLAPEKVDSAYLGRYLDFSFSHLYKAPKSALAHLEKVITLADSVGLAIFKGQGLYGAGIAKANLNQPSASIELLDSAAAIFWVEGDSGKYYRCRFTKGANLSNMGNFAASMEVSLEALAYFRRVEDRSMVMRGSNNIGGILFRQDRFRESIDYFRECSEEAGQLEQYMVQSLSLVNVGLSYIELDSLEEAESVYLESYQLNQEHGIPFVQSKACAQLADLALLQENYPLAEQYLEESIAAANETDDSLTLAQASRMQGDIAYNNGRYREALASYEKTSRMAERFEATETRMKAEKLVSKAHEKLGNYQEALLAYRTYAQLKDSILGEEEAEELASLTAQYDLEKQQFEVAQLEKEKALQDQVLEQQKWFIGGLAIAFAAAILLLIFAILGERRRHTINRRLEEKNAEMEGLIEVVAHDLKAPISKAQALLELAQTQNQSSEIENYLGMSEQVLDDGMELIGDILSIRQLESDSESRPMAPLDLTALLTALLQSFAGKAAAKEIRLQGDIPLKTVEIQSNAQAIERIMENLLSNALKFSPAGTEVAVAMGTSTEGVSISVQDQGPGISEAEQQLLFRKFQRGSAKPTAGEHSSGLGLSIVKALATQIGGRIKVESTLGKGSRFSLILPSH